MKSVFIPQTENIFRFVSRFVWKNVRFSNWNMNKTKWTQFKLPGTVLLMLNAGSVFAGMPTVRLTPEVRGHLSGISSSLFVVLIVASFLIFFCWNRFVRGTELPKISWFKSIIVALLGGILFCLILVMIAGSRELLTPGAWKQNGVLYELADNQKDLADMSAYDPVTLVPMNDLPESLAAARYAAVVRLRNELVRFQHDHFGRLPENIVISDFDPAYWVIPVSGGLTFVYQPKDPRYIVVMPQLNDSPILCIDTDNCIVERSTPVSLSDESVKSHNAQPGSMNRQKNDASKNRSKTNGANALTKPDDQKHTSVKKIIENAPVKKTGANNDTAENNDLTSSIISVKNKGDQTTVGKSDSDKKDGTDERRRK